MPFLIGATTRDCPYRHSQVSQVRFFCAAKKCFDTIRNPNFGKIS